MAIHYNGSYNRADSKGDSVKRTFSLLFLLVVTLGVGRVAAQVNPYKDGTPGVTGVRSEVMALVMIQENEFERLAQAIPADKYTWRPSAGVRSVADVFLHVCGANYNMYKLVAVQPPAGLDVSGIEESTTDKTKIIAMLRESYAHAKKAIASVPDADLEKTMDWRGGKLTERGVLMYIVPHIAEHLGQAIAYARVLGVVPPWSEDPPRK